MGTIFWKGKDRPATPAMLAIVAFGGLSALAQAIGKPVSTVQRWQETGLIPSRHQPDIISAAARTGIAFDPASLVPMPETAPVEAEVAA